MNLIFAPKLNTSKWCQQNFNQFGRKYEDWPLQQPPIIKLALTQLEQVESFCLTSKCLL